MNSIPRGSIISILLSIMVFSCGPSVRPRDLIELDRSIVEAQRSEIQQRAPNLLNNAIVWLKRANKAHESGDNQDRNVAMMNAKAYLAAAQNKSDAVAFGEQIEHENAKVTELKKKLTQSRDDLQRMQKGIDRMQRIAGTDLVGKLNRQLQEIELAGISPGDNQLFMQGKQKLTAAKNFDSQGQPDKSIIAAREGIKIIAPLYKKFESRREDIVKTSRMNLLADKLKSTFQGCEVAVSARGVILTLLDMFDRRYVELNANGVQYGRLLVPVAKEFKDFHILLEGHTDSYGSKNSNLALSQARAQAFHDLLQNAGISGVRLKAAGYGEDRPVAPNTREGRAKNRRIEVIFYLP